MVRPGSERRNQWQQAATLAPGSTWGTPASPQRSTSRLFSQSPFGDERRLRQLPALPRQPRPELMLEEARYRSPAGFTSWSRHWAKAMAVELALGQSETTGDHVGIRPATRQRLFPPSAAQRDALH